MSKAGGPYTTGSKELLLLLKSLARPGAVLTHLIDGCADQNWCVRRSDGKMAGHVNEAVMTALRRRDLLERRQEDYVLSQTGRQCLRRWLSEGDGFLDQHRELSTVNFKTESGAGHSVSQVNLAESPLAWLASRKDRKGKALLDPAQIEAGERLRADYGFARLMPTLSAGWRVGDVRGSGGASGRSADLSDDVIAARQRIEGVLKDVEPVLSTLLIDVCCHLKGLEVVEAERGWPARSGKVVLQIALTSLATRYGYRAVAGKGTGRIRSAHMN
ncbi:DUF6456 domain-containing protein [Roseibium algae]|uniref:DUF6456 domain-containing protein n=1 Tax=Roseibium algae TaxID=3123038 RepID=A0ABU8TID3_9HYPH